MVRKSFSSSHFFVACLMVALIGSFAYQTQAVSLPGIVITDILSVGGTQNSFALANTNYLKGGHMQVPDRSALFNTGAGKTISLQRRSVGMIATVVDDSDSYAFTVTGITTTPAVGQTYTNNSVTFTITSTDVTSGAGTIVGVGSGAPLSSGTLMELIDGAGDSSITFSANTASDGTGTGGEYVTYRLILEPGTETTEASDWVIVIPDASDGYNGGTNKYLTVDVNGNFSWGTPAGAGGADTALSNLASVAINSSLLPGTTNSINLGSATKTWKTLFLSSEGSINFNASSLTISYTSATNRLTFVGDSFVFPTTGITIGSSSPFSDSSGTLTLQNVDDLDPTTEATIEGEVDTLDYLDRIQGHQITLTGALTRVGAHALTLTTTGTTNVTFPTSGTLVTTDDLLVGATDQTSSETWLGVDAGGSGASASQTVFVGNTAGYGSGGANLVALGFSAGKNATSAAQSVFIGSSAGAFNTGTPSVGGSVFIGYRAGSAALTARNSIFIGTSSGVGDSVDNSVSGTSILIGNNTLTGGFSNSIALGTQAENSASNQLMIGSNTSAISTVIIGNGATSSSPGNTTISPTSGVGTDINGGSLILTSGTHTGGGVAGSILFKTSGLSVSPSSLTAPLATRVAIIGGLNETRVGIGTIAPSSTLDITVDDIGEGSANASSTMGISLLNTSAASVIAGQFSPTLRWRGMTFDSVSKPVDFRSFVRTSNISGDGYLAFGSSVDNAAYSDGQFVLHTGGNIGIGTGTTSAPSARVHAIASSGAQLRLGYDGLNYWSSTVGSGGTLTMQGAGSGGSFVVTTDAGNSLTYTDGGDLGLGVSPTYRLDVADNVADYAARIFNDGSNINRKGLLIQAGEDTPTTNNTLIDFNDGDGGLVGSITFDNLQTSFNQLSDKRLKENIVDTTLSIDKLRAITIHDYSYIKDPSRQTAHGVLAQELYAIYPIAVSKSDDGEGNLIEGARPWMVDYSKLTPLIIKSIQDLDIVVQGLASLDLENPTSLGSLVKQFLADNILSIKDLTAQVFRVDGDVCVDEVCITKEQFKQMLINGGGTQQNIATPTPPTEEDSGEGGVTVTPIGDENTTQSPPQEEAPIDGDSSTPPPVETVVEETSPAPEPVVENPPVPVE